MCTTNLNLVNNSQTLLENIKDNLQSEIFMVVQQSHRVAQKQAPELMLTLMSEIFSLTQGNLSSSTLLWDFSETEIPDCGCNSEILLFSCLNERQPEAEAIWQAKFNSRGETCFWKL